MEHMASFKTFWDSVIKKIPLKILIFKIRWIWEWIQPQRDLKTGLLWVFWPSRQPLLVGGRPRGGGSQWMTQTTLAPNNAGHRWARFFAVRLSRPAPSAGVRLWIWALFAGDDPDRSASWRCWHTDGDPKPTDWICVWTKRGLFQPLGSLTHSGTQHFYVCLETKTEI